MKTRTALLAPIACVLMSAVAFAQSPLPPPSAAGLVHAATIFGSGTLPNSVSAAGGTVERNDAYVMTHPVCDSERHSGTR